VDRRFACDTSARICHPGVDGLDLQPGRANFLIGDDPKQWRTDVPLYSRVVYKDLYPGVDMVYSSQARLLKSEFVVAPGADPARIRIAYSGVDGLRVDRSGRGWCSRPRQASCGNRRRRSIRKAARGVKP